MPAPLSIWPIVTLNAGATKDFRFKFYNENKTPAAIAASDVVRFKLKQSPTDDPALELSTLAPLSGGSLVTRVSNGVEGQTPAEVLVRFGQADTINLAAGQWWGVLGLVDDSETVPDNAFKVIAEGPILVRPKPGGTLLIT